MPKQWGVFEDGQDISVIPINDKKEHTHDKSCPCEPQIEIIGARILYIHNSFDFREVLEIERE